MHAEHHVLHINLFEMLGSFVKRTALNTGTGCNSTVVIRNLQRCKSTCDISDCPAV